MQCSRIDGVALGLTGARQFLLAGTLPPPPRLAVVGSRAAHRRHRDAVEPVVHAAARQGFCVLSGGAVGIDGDAHAAALAAGVPQLAVLPCGPDRVYPPQHAPLFDHVARAPGCGVVFAHAAGTVPTRAMFASRNAVVVALAQAVLVVEVADRSGTMLTATLARRRGRPRAVVLGSSGAGRLVAEGAHPLRWDPEQPEAFARAVDGWLRAVKGGEDPASLRAVPAWPEHLHWLRDAVEASGRHGLAVDAMPSLRVALAALTEAETLGLVVERGPGRYIAAY